MSNEHSEKLISVVSFAKKLHCRLLM